MKTVWKIIIISIVSGLVLSVLGLSLGASRDGLYIDKTGIHLISNSETRITELDLGRFNDINIDVDYSDVEFIPSDKYGIDICGNYGKWGWELTDGVLRIDNRETESIMSFFIFNTPINKESYVKIYLPQEAELKSVLVEANSGNVNIGGFKAGGVQINNSYGKIDINAITSDNLQIDSNSGDFTGTDLDAQNIIYKNEYGKGSFERINAQKLVADSNSRDFTLRDCKAVDVNITNEYGKIDLYSVTSDNLQIGSNSGDFTGTNLDAQNIIYKNEYGKGSFERINAQKLVADSNSRDFILKYCEVGDIDITNEYGKIFADGLYSSKTTIYTNSGDISLSGEFSGETVIRSSYSNVKISTSKEKENYSFDISTEYGKIMFDNENLGRDTSVNSGNKYENHIKIAAESGDVEVSFIK